MPAAPTAVYRVSRRGRIFLMRACPFALRCRRHWPGLPFIIATRLTIPLASELICHRRCGWHRVQALIQLARKRLIEREQQQ